MVFLAETGPLTGAMGSGAGFNIWQSLGGLSLVFGLLILSLKLLGRFNRRHNPGQTSLLTVWQLGPKREIQVLRLGNEVHYIYRHEGAMVLLKRETLEEWETSKALAPAAPEKPGLSSLLPGGFNLAALWGKSPRSRAETQAPARVAELLQSLES